jgi:hypothetical protein
MAAGPGARRPAAAAPASVPVGPAGSSPAAAAIRSHSSGGGSSIDTAPSSRAAATTAASADLGLALRAARQVRAAVGGVLAERDQGG